MSNRNNFDLIRLTAALQVASTHSLPYFVPESRSWYLVRFIELFPGVPVFFFVSGFLISKSFEKNSNRREYALNRALRIYPGLIVCFAASVAAAALSGYFSIVRPTLSEWLRWTAAQVSFLQFYNPEFMRGYGVGVLNGSMWTITVELQFYVLVPILYALLRRDAAGGRRTNLALCAAVALFWVGNALYLAGTARYESTIWFKLIGVSFIPWFYMFLVGVFFQRNSERLLAWFGGRFALAFVLYCVLAALGSSLLHLNLGNTLGLPLFLALAIVTFAAAFSRPQLSDNLLRRNDISYGVYIYHMPLVNLLIALGVAGNAVGFPIALSATLACAAISWRLVEKPALRWKLHPLYPHERLRRPAVREAGLSDGRELAGTEAKVTEQKVGDEPVAEQNPSQSTERVGRGPGDRHV
jgi:peptidoglycan/LPS O-acetylase OafA/YrhL